MTQPQLEQLWEACRDGSISDADRAAFEAYLRSNDTAAAMWKAESQWLGMIGDVNASFEGEANSTSQAFVAGVLNRCYETPQSEPAAVIGRIGPRRYLAPLTALAAMVAIVILSFLYANSLKNSDPIITPPLAKNPPTETNPATPPDAIGLLFASAKDGYALAAASPAKLKQGFSSTAAFFDVANLASFLDPGLPDPADFVEPKAGG